MARARAARSPGRPHGGYNYKATGRKPGDLLFSDHFWWFPLPRSSFARPSSSGRRAHRLGVSHHPFLALHPHDPCHLSRFVREPNHHGPEPLNERTSSVLPGPSPKTCYRLIIRPRLFDWRTTGDYLDCSELTICLFPYNETRIIHSLLTVLGHFCRDDALFISEAIWTKKWIV